MSAMTKTTTGTMPTNAEAVRRGRLCAGGASGRPDLVAAHRWFNVAAMNGDEDAAALRRDVAATMTKGELARALRGARETMRSALAA